MNYVSRVTGKLFSCFRGTFLPELKVVGVPLPCLSSRKEKVLHLFNDHMKIPFFFVFP